MNREHISLRCPHCGKPLNASELPGYIYQCLDCDEDFYAFEIVKLITVFSEPTQAEQKKFDDDGFRVDLSQKIKVSVSDEDEQGGFTYIAKEDVERLGLDYIKNHVRLEYSAFFGDWFVRMSQNDYYNDTQRNPEKIIPVQFVKIESGTGREVYKGTEDGRYYLRSVSTHENFAKWLICGGKRAVDDRCEPRANLIFRCGDQTEKVTYDDWNGVCAYSNTFNRNFH